MKSNFLDKAIGYISPKTQLERVRARDYLFRYEGAQDSRSRQRATVKALSPESSMYQRDRIQIMYQSRDLMENEALLKSILLKVCNYAIGKIKYVPITGDAMYDKYAEDYFAEWCNRCDLTGRHSFKVLCHLLLMD